MIEPQRIIKWPARHSDSEDFNPTREWLVTNGLGGYASGTVSGALTRRFHGILIAALPSPYGRMMMLNDCIERVTMPDGKDVRLGAQERADTGMQMNGARHLAEFRMEWGLPVWRYEIDGTVIEKRVMLVYGQNTSMVTYAMLEGEGQLCLELRPAVQIRPHEGKLGEDHGSPYELSVIEDLYELCAHQRHLPPLRLMIHDRRAAFTFDREWVRGLTYEIERARGYDYKGDLWSPGYFRVEMTRGHSTTLIASTESWELIRALNPEEAAQLEHERRRRLVALGGDEIDETAAELMLAADQFIITPAGRVEDQARARAAGDEMRTVIAGYHWFTDWGRDTMISLEGLTLATKRTIQARYILRTFAHYIRDGLIPNMFPEGQTAGLYHTADATMWFFQALHRYVAATADRVTLRTVLPQLLDIVEHHLRGTRFNIHVDASDGLLAQGAEGYQLTWMDAKVDGWVVTPRRGKAVEINALWYNALRLLEGWLRDEGKPDEAQRIAGYAERAHESFNRRFWYEAGGYLFDVVDGEHGGDDPACRPNQIFAISLEHEVLDRSRWQAVVEVVRERLLTPVGLRSLAPSEKDYKSRYDGDLRSRDAAYHQGTVWAWLIGPFVDAWLKLHPEDRQGARRFLEGLVPHLSEACIGSVSEIFDAEPPFTPRGCVAQAWSVAEMLRCWLKTK